MQPRITAFNSLSKASAGIFGTILAAPPHASFKTGAKGTNAQPGSLDAMDSILLSPL